MFSPHLLPYYISAGISLVVAGYAYRWRRPGGILYFALFALSQGLWTLFSTFELRAEGIEAKLFWDNIQWVFFAFLGPLFFEFVIAYSRLERVPAPRVRLLLLIPIPIFLALVFTNASHGWVYTGAHIVANQPYDALVYPYSVPVTLFSMYILGYILGGITMLSARFLTAGIALRNQIIYILIGTFVPILFIFLAAVFDIRLMGQRDWTPLSFALGNAVIALGIFRDRLFFVVPIARDIIFENLADSVLVLSDTGYILDANSTARAGASAGNARIVGERVDLIYPSWKPIIDRLGGVETYRGVEHADNRVYELQISPVYSHQDDLLARIVIVRDITDQYAAEMERLIQVRLREALEHERALNEMKTHLMRRIAHEFRTPLSIIQLSQDVLKRYSTLMEEDARSERLSNISRQVEVLTDMLEDIHHALRFRSFGDTPNRTSVDARKMCQQIIDDLTNTIFDGRIVEIESPLPQVWVSVDRYGLRIWLSNLISNALKYSEPPAPVTVRLKMTGSSFILEVIDRGIGIPAEDLPHIFDPFHRANNTQSISGLGLGLSLVRDTVRAHGGEITITSQEGQGTNFTICIPEAVGMPEEVML